MAPKWLLPPSPSASDNDSAYTEANVVADVQQVNVVPKPKFNNVFADSHLKPTGISSKAQSISSLSAMASSDTSMDYLLKGVHVTNIALQHLPLPGTAVVLGLTEKIEDILAKSATNRAELNKMKNKLKGLEDTLADFTEIRDKNLLEESILVILDNLHEDLQGLKNELDAFRPQQGWLASIKFCISGNDIEESINQFHDDLDSALNKFDRKLLLFQNYNARLYHLIAMERLQQMQKSFSNVVGYQEYKEKIEAEELLKWNGPLGNRLKAEAENNLPMADNSEHSLEPEAKVSDGPQNLHILPSNDNSNTNDNLLRYSNSNENSYKKANKDENNRMKNDSPINILDPSELNDPASALFSSKSSDMVLNPETGRMVKLGGNVYNDLVRRGVVKPTFAQKIKSTKLAANKTRSLDVDDYLVDEDVYVDETPNIPYDQLANETNLKIQNTRSHLQRNDLVNALIASLEPCYQYDDLKLKSLENVLSVVTSVKTLDIPNVLKQLNTSQLDILVKYIYKGMSLPASFNPALLLTWHEKAVEIGGTGCIVRCLTDRLTV
ncbi:hypothetical protein HDV06_003572 [Boothiomyces sp. JEL0866]|nr:hypothetical protein HDV06_003572 [Boothiomyces sp. JEL0866]